MSNMFTNESTRNYYEKQKESNIELEGDPVAPRRVKYDARRQRPRPDIGAV
jgi:hypothetical protein